MPVSSFSESQHLASFVYKINHSSLGDFSLSNYRGCGYEKKGERLPKGKEGKQRHYLHIVRRSTITIIPLFTVAPQPQCKATSNA